MEVVVVVVVVHPAVVVVVAAVAVADEEEEDVVIWTKTDYVAKWISIPKTYVNGPMDVAPAISPFQHGNDRIQGQWKTHESPHVTTCQTKEKRIALDRLIKHHAQKKTKTSTRPMPMSLTSSRWSGVVECVGKGSRCRLHKDKRYKRMGPLVPLFITEGITYLGKYDGAASQNAKTNDASSEVVS